MTNRILTLFFAIAVSGTAFAQSAVIDLSTPMTGPSIFATDVDGKPVERGVPIHNRYEALSARMGLGGAARLRPLLIGACLAAPQRHVADHTTMPPAARPVGPALCMLTATRGRTALLCVNMSVARLVGVAVDGGDSNPLDAVP